MSFFQKILRKKKKKLPFLLVEVIVAILLISVVGFSFFQIEQKIAKKVQEFRIKAEGERAGELALSQLVERLTQKKILADQIEGQKSISLTSPNSSWTANCNFTIADSDNKDLPKVLLVEAKITLSYTEFQFHIPPILFHFCWHKSNLEAEKESDSEEELENEQHL